LEFVVSIFAENISSALFATLLRKKWVFYADKIIPSSIANRADEIFSAKMLTTNSKHLINSFDSPRQKLEQGCLQTGTASPRKKIKTKRTK
jgi:hypothetical protein